MRIRLESVKRIGRKIGLNEDKGYAVAIFLALIIVSATIIGYYVVLRPQTEPYNTIYLLDANKKAVDYSEVLVANQNSTFSVYVDVENHMAASASYFVQVKITQNLPAIFPIDVQPSQVIDMGTINNDGRPVQQTATVTQNTPGSYSVVFELYRNNGDGALVFTQNYCVLNIQVIN
jgi:uncharacterized membrane protein